MNFGIRKIDSRKYFIGIYRRDLNQLQFVSVQNDKIFNMNQFIKTIDNDYKIDMDTIDDDSSEQKRQLIVNFGNRRGQRRVRESLNNLIAPDQVQGLSTINKILDEKAEQHKLLTKEKEIESALTRNLPPYNISATKVEQAYPLDRIVTKEELQAIPITEFIEQNLGDVEKLKELYATNMYSTFVMREFSSLKNQKFSDTKKKAKASLIMVMHYFFCFYRFVNNKRVFFKKDLYKDDSLALIPKIFIEKFLTLFADRQNSGAQKSRYSVPKDRKDLLIYYVLVLYLTINGFRAESFFLTDLKLKVLDLNRYFGELGCRRIQSRKFIEKDRNAFMARLEVPLKFPDKDEYLKAKSSGSGRGRGRGRGKTL